jgi:dipeptidyl-peptidase-4
VFATGEAEDPNAKPGSLFKKVQTAYDTMPHPKPPPPPPTAAAAKLDEKLLEQIAFTRAFRLGAPTQMTPTPDGRAVLFLRSGARDTRQSLFKLDVEGGSVHELVTPERLSTVPENLSPEERARRERMRVRGTGLTSFELTKDGLAIVIPFAGRIHVFDRTNGLVRELPTGEGAAIDPQISPDGKRVGYVRGDDLYTIDVAGKGPEVRVTTGGTEGKPHGLAEFIAQEELDRDHGFFFSPDSQTILFEEADQTRVERLTLADFAHPERDPDRPYYPRAGHNNAILKFGLVSARGGSVIWVQWEREKFPYVAQVRWEDGPPVMYVMDREQKNAQLLQIDPKNGQTKPLVIDHDDVYLEVDSTVPRFLADGRRFYWSTERDGERRLEIRSDSLHADEAGAYVTPKGFGYRGLLDIDEGRTRVVVEGSAEPAETGIFSVALVGGEPQPIGTHPGVVHASFGRSHDIYASYEANTTHYPNYFVVSVDGKKRVTIPHVSERPPYEPSVEIMRVGPDQVRVAVIRPHGMVKGARIPVIDAAYGGPGAQVAVADAIKHVQAQFIADATGAIVVAMDVKGTPNRTRAWSRAIYGKMGEVPVSGHVDTLKELAKVIPEMDMSRVGVYGWSFGGYFSAYAALKHPSIYKVAAAGAPVTDWREYDTAYTERYMGAPGPNQTVYDDQSLFTAAKKTSTPRPILLIHGTADDNVYFSNSLRLTEALQAAKVPVEFLPLTDQTHLVRSPEATMVVWRRVAEFLLLHLSKPEGHAIDDLNPYVGPAPKPAPAPSSVPSSSAKPASTLQLAPTRL